MALALAPAALSLSFFGLDLLLLLDWTLSWLTHGRWKVRRLLTLLLLLPLLALLLLLPLREFQPKLSPLQQVCPHAQFAGCSRRLEALLCQAAALIRLTQDLSRPIVGLTTNVGC